MGNYRVPLVSEIKELNASRPPLFEAVSLFAGGGGSSTGYRMAGGKILAINEFIEAAIQTYQANWPDTIIIPEDIRKITAQDILEKIGKEKGELDILDGSPPCSAFSTAGKRDKGWGKTKTYSDSKQDSVEDLFFEYARILEGVMPKVFIAENVAGLAKGVSKGYLNQILRALKGCGYHVECKILDAKYLGVPQRRARLIFVGVRNDLFKPEHKGRLHPTPVTQTVSLRDAFDGLELTELERKETDMTKYRVYQYLVPLKRGECHVKRFNLYKCDPLDIAFCITATSGTISAARPCHWDNRSFSVREFKRIMSVPDDYILIGTYQQQVERLGRMVAPFMMRAVAENITRLGIL